MCNRSSNTAGILGIIAVATIVGILAIVLLRRKRKPIHMTAQLVKESEVTCITLKQ